MIHELFAVSATMITDLNVFCDSTGDYASAIETLVTAISLIKQSKVAPDERCKILVSSLQDTLRGIEAKSYGSRRGMLFHSTSIGEANWLKLYRIHSIMHMTSR